MLRQITSLSKTNPINEKTAGLNILPIGFYLIVKPHLPLLPTAPKYVTNPLPPYKNMSFEATIIQETKMEVYVDKHHIRLRHLYVMPLASTFLDEESMDDCIRKAMEWC